MTPETNDPQPTVTPAEGDYAEACRAVFSLMERHHIDVLDVEYDGCGDSGQIENINGYALPDSVDASAIEPDPCRPEAWPKAESLDDALFHAADRALSAFDPISGWENNDGAFGTLTFNHIHRRALIDHNWRVMETENTTFAREVIR